MIVEVIPILTGMVGTIWLTVFLIRKLIQYVFPGFFGEEAESKQAEQIEEDYSTPLIDRIVKKSHLEKTQLETAIEEIKKDRKIRMGALEKIENLNQFKIKKSRINRLKAPKPKWIHQ